MTEEQNRKCIHAELKATRPGDYTVYVFENISPKPGEDPYVMCTKCPMWNTPDVSVGQKGFLSYQVVNAGEHKWYKHTTNEMINYAYSAVYFLDFVPITHVLENNVVVSAQSLIVT